MEQNSAGGKCFDSVAAGYDFMESHFNNNDWFVSKMPSGRSRAIDVGCGSGILAFELAKHFDEVVGIDISEKMIEIAKSQRNRRNIEYIHSDARLAQINGGFDYIVSRTTFHHIPDVHILLEKLKSSLSPGGRIAILDCVCENQTPSTFNFVAFTPFEFARNLFVIGPAAAAKVLRFRLSKPWLEHLKNDRYLSESKFRETFGTSLPGCSFEKVACFFSAVWDRI